MLARCDVRLRGVENSCRDNPILGKGGLDWVRSCERFWFFQRRDGSVLRRYRVRRGWFQGSGFETVSITEVLDLWSSRGSVVWKPSQAYPRRNREQFSQLR